MRSFNGIQLFYFYVHLAFKALKVALGLCSDIHSFSMHMIRVCLMSFAFALTLFGLVCFFRLDGDWVVIDWVDDWKYCFIVFM